MSMSDVVVLDRGGQRRAYYADEIGFKEVKRFLSPERSKAKPERGEER